MANNQSRTEKSVGQYSFVLYRTCNELIVRLEGRKDQKRAE